MKSISITLLICAAMFAVWYLNFDVNRPKNNPIFVYEKTDTPAICKQSIGRDTIGMSVEDFFIYSGVWKIVYNQNTKLYALKQVKESDPRGIDRYTYYMAWLPAIEEGPLLEHPENLGIATFDMVLATVITSKDTMYLKKILHAYLVYAHKKDVLAKYH